MLRCTDTLTPDERHEIHNARVVEVQKGEITAGDFIKSLVDQVGFTFMEAESQLVEVERAGMIPVAEIGSRVLVKFHGEWEEGRVIKTTSQGQMLIVQFPHGVQLPYYYRQVRVQTS